MAFGFWRLAFGVRQVDCLALRAWDDGRGWAASGVFRSSDVDWQVEGEWGRELMRIADEALAAAGCGYVGEYETADSVAQSIEKECDQPPEVAEAMLLMAGESELAKLA